VEALLDGEAEALTRKAIERAKEGDSVALRLCLERILPPRKDRPVSFSLPKIESAADAGKASTAILTAVATGDVKSFAGLRAGQTKRRCERRPTDEPPFSGTLLNLPPAMISWYQDRAFLLPAEVLFQDRDRPVLRLPSAFYCR
jgi:hypothetical protein